MASVPDQRAVSTSATIVRMVALLSFLHTLFFTVVVSEDPARFAHAGLQGSARLLERVDCIASLHHDEAPDPACPRHAHCCVLGSALLEPPEFFRAFVFLRSPPDETAIIGLVAEAGDRGPDPSPPWSSRAPPLFA
jgi:hypothetical protein